MDVIQSREGFAYPGIDAYGVAECGEGGVRIDQVIVVVVVIARRHDGDG